MDFLFGCRCPALPCVLIKWNRSTLYHHQATKYYKISTFSLFDCNLKQAHTPSFCFYFFAKDHQGKVYLFDFLGHLWPTTWISNALSLSNVSNVNGSVCGHGIPRMDCLKYLCLKISHQSFSCLPRFVHILFFTFYYCFACRPLTGAYSKSFTRLAQLYSILVHLLSS